MFNLLTSFTITPLTIGRPHINARAHFIAAVLSSAKCIDWGHKHSVLCAKEQTRHFSRWWLNHLGLNTVLFTSNFVLNTVSCDGQFTIRHIGWTPGHSNDRSGNSHSTHISSVRMRSSYRCRRHISRGATASNVRERSVTAIWTQYIVHRENIRTVIIYAYVYNRTVTW